MFQKAVTGVLLGSALLAPVLAFGQVGSCPPGTIGTPPDCRPVGNQTTINSATGLVGVVSNVVQWVTIIFYIIAVLFLILAAFKYLTSGGDSTKVGEAKQMIIYAVIAIAVALLAGGMTTIVRNFLNSGG